MVDNLSVIVERARLIIQILSNMDDTKAHREIRNSLDYHWSITYNIKNNTFHIYLEDSKPCYVVKFVDPNSGNYDYFDRRSGIALSFKRATTHYKEGTSSIILVYTDYADGPSRANGKPDWNLSDYRKFINEYGTSPYFYY